MLVLIEGQDGSGKSTLVRLLRERDLLTRTRDCPLPPPVTLKAGRPTAPNLLAEYLQPLLHYSPAGQDTVLCDRWLLGELVYPQLTGRRSLAEPAQLRYLVDWLRARGALLVYLTAPAGIVRRRILDRDPADPDADPQAIEQQAKLFAAAVAEVRRLGLNTLTIDTAREPPNWATGSAGTIMRQASRLAHHAAEVTGVYSGEGTGRELAHYVGSLAPRLLLVGDEQGPAYPELTVPFAPLRRGCGAFLWQALADTEPAALDHPGEYRALEGRLQPLGLSDLGVVNGNDPRRRFDADLAVLWRRLGEPPVAALGANALTAVRRAGLPIASTAVLPHPQWVRRFHHPRLTSYGAATWASATTHTGEDLRETWQTYTP